MLYEYEYHFCMCFALNWIFLTHLVLELATLELWGFSQQLFFRVIIFLLLFHYFDGMMQTSDSVKHEVAITSKTGRIRNIMVLGLHFGRHYCVNSKLMISNFTVFLYKPRLEMFLCSVTVLCILFAQVCV